MMCLILKRTMMGWGGPVLTDVWLWYEWGGFIHTRTFCEDAGQDRPFKTRDKLVPCSWCYSPSSTPCAEARAREMAGGHAPSWERAGRRARAGPTRVQGEVRVAEIDPLWCGGGESYVVSRSHVGFGWCSEPLWHREMVV